MGLMACTICGELHETKDCPKRQNQEDRDSDPYEEFLPSDEGETLELPEYAKIAMCYHLSGGG
jgi:hypothetical protein